MVNQMRIVSGKIQNGCGHFTKRMCDYPDVFENATGEKLYPGTLNIHTDDKVPVHEHFRIIGQQINEPNQDLLFEICRVNGIWAYRIRPLNLENGKGGHGDHVLEIACKIRLRDMDNFKDNEIKIELFRALDS